MILLLAAICGKGVVASLCHAYQRILVVGLSRNGSKTCEIASDHREIDEFLDDGHPAPAELVPQDDQPHPSNDIRP